ncbi:unnamed protein product [Notodromas monacha]|uniref:Uncharacterized protein n=1 Tax=Notodromas monacha TaxID=399045 RepID=A0A7R9BEM3_9CRUS|nr:unnamed protein product [Notodromas monacha]CAG0913083.1 unnamed protein product [Notodromas monacha]
MATCYVNRKTFEKSLLRVRKQEKVNVESLDARPRFTFEDFEADVSGDDSKCDWSRCELPEPLQSWNADDITAAAPEFGALPGVSWSLQRRPVTCLKRRRNRNKAQGRLFVVYDCYPVLLLPVDTVVAPK